MTLGQTETGQAITDLEGLLVEAGEACSQATDSPVLSGEGQQSAVVGSANLTKGWPFPLPIHEDRCPVRLAAIATAPAFSAAAGNRAQASFEEGVRVAEIAEDRGELALESIEFLPVGTGIVVHRTPL
jgi:hypothetical protein